MPRRWPRRRAGLIAIVCIGETRAEREPARHHVGPVPPDRRLGGAECATHANTVIAYEPVWAIGTGLTPTVADVAEAHAHIRAELGRPDRRGGEAHAHPLWRLG